MKVDKSVLLVAVCLLTVANAFTQDLRTVTGVAGWQTCPNNTQCATASMCCCSTESCVKNPISNNYECLPTREYTCCPSTTLHPLACASPSVCVADSKALSGYICATPANPTPRPTPTPGPTPDPMCQTKSTCESCADVTGCDWCPSSSTCMRLSHVLECESVVILSSTSCPKIPKTHNYVTKNSNTVLATFIVLFILQFGVGYLVFHNLRKKIDPIAFAHSSRTSVSDFSAIPNHEEITEILKNDCPQGPVWADVSLKVPTLYHLLPMGIANIFGLILAAIAPLPVMSIVFLLFMIPGFVYIISGIYQIYAQHHFGNVYWMTEDGAVIRTNGWHGPITHFFPFAEMKNVFYKNSEFGTGHVYFAQNWPVIVKPEETEEEAEETGNENGNGSPLMRETDDVKISMTNTKQEKQSSFRLRKKRIGFENITKHQEIYDQIQSKITTNNPTQPSFNNSYVQFSSKLSDF